MSQTQVAPSGLADDGSGGGPVFITELRRAIRAGDVAAVTTLLGTPDATQYNLNARHPVTGSTLLMDGLSNADAAVATTIAMALLAAGASPDYPDGTGALPRTLLADRVHEFPVALTTALRVPTVESVIDTTPVPGVNPSPGAQNGGPVRSCAPVDRRKFVLGVYKKLSLNPTEARIPDPTSGTSRAGSLLLLASHYCITSIVRNVVGWPSISSEIDRVDSKGKNALMYAATSPYTNAGRCIRLLRFAGARVDIVTTIDGVQRTVLDMCTYNDVKPLLLGAIAPRVLSGVPASPTVGYVSLSSDEEAAYRDLRALTAEQKRFVEWVEKLVEENITTNKTLELDTVSGVTKYGSLLLLAAHHASVPALKRLLMYGRTHSPTGAPLTHGSDTPSMLSRETTGPLPPGVYSINLSDKHGMTPLLYAAQSMQPHSLECVALLLEEGASTEVVNVKGQTALALTEEWQHEDKTSLIRGAIRAKAFEEECDISRKAAESTGGAGALGDISRKAAESTGGAVDSEDTTEGLPPTQFPVYLREVMAREVTRLIATPTACKEPDLLSNTSTVHALMAGLCYFAYDDLLQRLLAECPAARQVDILMPDIRRRTIPSYAAGTPYRMVPCMKVLTGHFAEQLRGMAPALEQVAIENGRREEYEEWLRCLS